MKLAIFFRRTGAPRRNGKATSDRLASDWTTRDWADLPPCHPRRD